MKIFPSIKSSSFYFLLVFIFGFSLPIKASNLQKPPIHRNINSRPVLIAQAASYESAVQRFDSGKYAEAISIFTRIISSNPSRSQKNLSLMGRAKSYLLLGQPGLAILDLNKIKYNDFETKENGELALMKGATYLQLKKYKLSIKYTTDALNILPNNASGYSNRAVALKALNRLEAARRDYIKSLSLISSASTVYNLAVLEAELGNYSACSSYLTDVIKTNPKYIQVYFQRGFCLSRLGNNDDLALTDLLKVISEDSSNPKAMEEIGIILLRNNKRESGVTYIEKASEVYLGKGDIDNYTRVLSLINAEG